MKKFLFTLIAIMSLSIISAKSNIHYEANTELDLISNLNNSEIHIDSIQYDETNDFEKNLDVVLNDTSSLADTSNYIVSNKNSLIEPAKIVDTSYTHDLSYNYLLGYEGININPPAVPVYNIVSPRQFGMFLKTNQNNK